MVGITTAVSSDPVLPLESMPAGPGSVAATARSAPAAAARRYDKRDGRGKMTFVRGLQYDGEWKDDKAHGWVPGVSRVCEEWQ